MAAPAVAAAAKAAAQRAAKAATKRAARNAARDGQWRRWLMVPAAFGVVAVAAVGGQSTLATVGSQPAEDAVEQVGAGMIDLARQAAADTSSDGLVPWELIAATGLVLTDNGLTSPYPDTGPATQIVPIRTPPIEPPDTESVWAGGGVGLLLWSPTHPATPDDPNNTPDSYRTWAAVLDTAARNHANAAGVSIESIIDAGLTSPGATFWTTVVDSLIEVRYACDPETPPAPILLPTTTTTTPPTTTSTGETASTQAGDTTTTSNPAATETTATTTAPVVTAAGATDDPVLIVLQPCPPPVEIDPDGPAQFSTPTTTPAAPTDGPTSVTSPTPATADTSGGEATASEPECVSGCSPPRLVQPAPPRPAGSQIVAKARWLTGDGDDIGGFIEGALIGVDPTAAAAYRQAVAGVRQLWPNCDLDIYLLAGIGRVESNHGTHNGATVAPDGTVDPPIRNSESTAKGPMQILDGTWDDIGTDGNNDGALDRDNYFDAALGAANLLCKFLPDGVDARTDAGQRAMVRWYNPTPGYYEKVVGFGQEMRARDQQSGLGISGVTGGVDVGVGTNANALTRRCGPRPSQQRPGGLIIPCTTRSVSFPLIQVPTAVPGEKITLSHVAAPYAEALMAAANQAGIPLSGGGYRSADSQIAVRKNNCGTSYDAIYLWPSGRCSPPTARPGSSMHELGEAMDLTCAGALITSRSSPCWIWLDTYAHLFGFYMLSSETWHWSTNAS